MKSIESNSTRNIIQIKFNQRHDYLYVWDRGKWKERKVGGKVHRIYYIFFSFPL